MVGFASREKKFETVFLITFSILVFVLFFFFVGSNGLILGNDPAVHLEYAKFFLSTGSFPLTDILWLPPLYHLVLATFISFTGITSAGQQVVLVKAVVALMNWMLILSVYLLAAKFFNKKTGIIAASFLLLSFPLFELNSWGGYTSLLSLTFMVLLFVYLALPLKSIGNSLVAFILAFSVVLTHQLATFLLVFVLPPFIIIVLARSKGHYPKALIAAVVGGGIAFGIYYLRPILPYFWDLIYIVFFRLQTMAYQIPAVSSNSFMMYFGFIVFLAFAGVILAFFELKKTRSLSFYFLLLSAFIVPLFFSQSYLVGFFLPFQWFVYFLLPALVIFAAVAFIFVIDLALQSYSNNKQNWKRISLQLVSITIIFVLVASMVLHFQTLSSKLSEDAEFYSTSNFSAYQAGTWLSKNNQDSSSKLVVTKNPGHWLWVYSGLNIIAETDPVVDWNYNASCVLDMSYELQHPLTMTRIYEARSNMSDSSYVSTNGAWKQAIFFPEDTAFVSYRDKNGSLLMFKLSDLNRSIFMDEVNYPKKISIEYSSQDFKLTENILMENYSYPVTYTWQLTALGADLNYPTIHLSEYFDQQLSFNKVNIPGLLTWESPLTKPSYQVVDNWAATDFYKENFTTTNNKIDIIAEQNQAGFALNFLDLPDYGNVGALWSGNLDAVRWQYGFFKINANFTVSVSYQMLAFSMSSYPQIKELKKMNSLFDSRVEEPFDVMCRNFAQAISENYVGYVVYDLNRFDKRILSSEWVLPVYSNDKYVILKIKSDHPYANVLETEKTST